jgi:hypothetical protein
MTLAAITDAKGQHDRRFATGTLLAIAVGRLCLLPAAAEATEKLTMKALQET